MTTQKPDLTAPATLERLAKICRMIIYYESSVVRLRKPSEMNRPQVEIIAETLLWQAEEIERLKNGFADFLLRIKTDAHGEYFGKVTIHLVDEILKTLETPCQSEADSDNREFCT